MSEFDVLTYLKGRREYLKAMIRIWPVFSSKNNCAQARLHEVQELIVLMDATRQQKDQTSPTGLGLGHRME
jgi:hypothetical protein